MTSEREAELLSEIAALKQRLGFAHTKINDLRYAKKERDKYIDKIQKEKRACLPESTHGILPMAKAVGSR